MAVRGWLSFASVRTAAAADAANWAARDAGGGGTEGGGGGSGGGGGRGRAGRGGMPLDALSGPARKSSGETAKLPPAQRIVRAGAAAEGGPFFFVGV